MSDLRETFTDPGPEFRGKPFWAWNGRLHAGELVRQINVMHRMGFGGFFMHSRVGLATPYLSEEWFRLIRECVEAGDELGMEAWLYDEDRWPSGAAGGLVTKDAKYRQRRLALEVMPARKFKPTGKELAVFTGHIEESALYDLAQVRSPKEPKAKAGESVLAFYIRVSPESPWYNNQTYLDTLSHEAVRKFIAVTYDAYAREAGQEFGSLVPGIFTDEPNHGGTGGAIARGEGTMTVEAPWTEVLPKVFKERYGYDLLPHLPAIFFDVDGQRVSKARRDYHDCKTFLFVEAFARQIGEWCGKHKLLFTGHVLEEQRLLAQGNVVGSAMRFYEHMQAPGIDILTQFGREYLTAKQCASVHHQMGRKWLLSELYGCTGWDFTFEGHKAVGDWQAALGVNLRCLHLSWYTMLGEAKRDYPASIFYHSPWWKEYPAVEDYFARLGVLLTRGEPVRDLLVIHPIESAWVRMHADWPRDPEAAQADRDLEELQQVLLEAHYDFDYGDEEMMSRLSKVTRAKAGVTISVGKAKYRAVVVPPMLTIRETTLRLLEKFRAAGGTVVFIGSPPQTVDCEPSDEAAELAMNCDCVAMKAEAIAEALRGKATHVSVADATGREFAPALIMLRKEGTRHILFVCNTDREHGCDELTITVPVAGKAAEWDPQVGEVFRAEAREKQGSVQIRTSLPPSGSRLFVIDPDDTERLPRRKKMKPPARRQPLRATECEVLLDEPNVLVLDRASYFIGSKSVVRGGPEEILRIDQLIRDTVGLPRRGGQMVQPWARQGEPEGCDNLVLLLFRFYVAEEPTGPLHLVVEQPEHFFIAVNRHLLSVEDDEGWWVDPSFRKLPVAPWMLREGENVIGVTFSYCEDDGLEAMYLLGDFGVMLDGTEATLVAKPTRLQLGDWVRQGLPFYSSAVTYQFPAKLYSQKGERVFLTFSDFRATCVRVRVNGKETDTTGWPPYEVEITDSVGEGDNMIEVDVISSRRNVFGPLHLVDPDPRWTGPGEYVTAGSQWRDDYHLKPAGLMQAPVVEYRR